MEDLVIKKTIVEMFRDRNYVFPNNFDAPATIETISDYLRTGQDEAKINSVVDSLTFINNDVQDSNDLVTDDRGNFVYVLILDDDSGFYKGEEREFAVREASKRLRKVFPDLGITKKMEDLVEFLHIVIVYNATKNKKGEYDVSKYEEPSLDVFNLEIWPKHMLRFNVTKHSKVPRHTLMTQDEMHAHMAHFNLTPSGCQKIMINDPVIRYYYGQPKQMFKIVRIGQDINYRMVIKVNLAGFKPKPSR
jgi:DNA-directed RNA polymerase subunit H (RpoH/RPB5)